MALNPADLVVIGVVLLSALLAFARGFVREVLSIGGWVGAAVGTLFLFPVARPYMRHYISPIMLADIVTGVGIFITLLIILTAISHQVAKGVRGSALNAIDRSLGFLFGIVRGLVIVSLAYLAVQWIWPVGGGNEPAWLKDSKTRTYVEACANFLQSLVPDATRNDLMNKAKAGSATIQQGMAIGQALRTLDGGAAPVQPAPGNGALPLPPASGTAAAPATPGTGAAPAKDSAPQPEEGYNTRDRNDLNRLIKTSQ